MPFTIINIYMYVVKEKLVLHIFKMKPKIKEGLNF